MTANEKSHQRLLARARQYRLMVAEGMTQKEIADAEGVSKQRVQQVMRKGFVNYGAHVKSSLYARRQLLIDIWQNASSPQEAANSLGIAVRTLQWRVWLLRLYGYELKRFTPKRKEIEA